MRIDENEVRKALITLKQNGEPFEIRVMADGYTHSAYFDDTEIAVKELKALEQKLYNSQAIVYITLQKLKDGCMSRSQANKFKSNRNLGTTSDPDVESYEWLMIDVDPKRLSGTSSTNEELKKAKEISLQVHKFLGNLGFERPIYACSGNGYHLLYKIDIPNDSNKVSSNFIKSCLMALDMLFSDDDVKIDIVNHNASRICKLYGTLAEKGSNTEDRPHRMSKLLIDSPESAEIKTTNIEYLKKLVGQLPQQIEEKRSYNNYSPSNFDLDEWLDKYSVGYRKSAFSGGDKYILGCCPFNSNHKGKDACIFKGNNGAISFKCFHDSCSDKTWKDVRMLFEPDAYEKRQQEYERKAYRTFNRDRKIEPKKIVQEEGKPLFFTAEDIFNMPQVEETFVRTGIHDIDKRLRGLKKGYVSLWSGLRASAKSTVLSQIIINARNEGNNVACYSGELAPKNFMKWLNLQVAGKNNVEPTQYEGYYTVSRQNRELIAKWLGDGFFLYNNEYGNDFKALYNEFEKVIVEKKLDLLILDNLMSFNITGLADNKWDSQTTFIWSIHELAQKHNVHICLVAHPRKALGFLRLDDISGSNDLVNAVDDAFIVHRVNNDFKRLTKQMFGWKDDEPLYDATNVIEIAKDRDGGTCDYFVPLWYEIESKRLKNHLTENVVYDFKNNGGFEQTEVTPFD